MKDALYAGGGRPMYTSDDDDDESDRVAAAPLLDPRNRHAEDDDAGSDNDDEMMNPYIMNPSFHSVKGCRSRNLDSAALMPPSMELANAATTSQRRQRSALDTFDPYSPAPGIEQKCFDNMRLELEEESIDFMSPSSTKANPSEKTKTIGKLTIFGPLLHEQKSMEESDNVGFDDVDSTFFESTSFSPVIPKHHSAQRQPHYCKNAEYSEAMPLSGNPGAARRRKSQYYYAQSALGTSAALLGDVVSLIANGRHSHPLSQSSSHRRQQFGGTTSSRHQYSRHSWITYFRLFVVVLATIFALSTIKMMTHMIFGYIDTSSSIAKYQVEAEAAQSTKNDKPDSLILKKIESARLKAREKKLHWWNRNRDGYVGEKKDVVKDETGLETAELNETDSDNSKHPANNKEALQGIIVESAEDGTLLIRLPPPKMRLEQSFVSKRSPPVTLATSNMITSEQEQHEETVLVKLPYQERRTLSEKFGSGNKLKFNHPPPWLDHGFHISENEHEYIDLQSLRSEFNSWVSRHKKSYSSHNEKEHRFQIWQSSHHRIQKKNKIHGPCRLTGNAVFGHGPFSDLSPDEFRAKYLTGYHRPREYKQGEVQASGTTRGFPLSRRTKGEILPPVVGSVKRHPTIQRKLDEHVAGKYQANFVSGCGSWLDVSCILRKIFGYAIIGGTREPVYDANSYPSALDWRAMGTVSSVHSQDTCGACWAITAVETIESAYAIHTGKLINLSEEEVISCDGTCDMCNGGWPQNAYEYVMKHGGLPQRSKNYDADFLLTVTSVINKESSALSEYDMSNYFGQICPSGSREGGGDSGSHSHSGDVQYDATSSAARYGKIKGYGYATNRCICYTDGSGCNCDKQNEKTAVLNIASYGPAAVCLEASTWVDYTGGIITSDSGCGSAFKDMNHCVEVVGYAYTDKDENSHGNSRDGDGGKREGYWIVKNQWSSYWGMGGYAYVAMGNNTCGILVSQISHSLPSALGRINAKLSFH